MTCWERTVWGALSQVPAPPPLKPSAGSTAAGSLARVMSTGGSGPEGDERPLRRAPQLAVLLEGGDRKGLLRA